MPCSPRSTMMYPIFRGLLKVKMTMIICSEIWYRTMKRQYPTLDSTWLFSMSTECYLASLTAKPSIFSREAQILRPQSYCGWFTSSSPWLWWSCCSISSLQSWDKCRKIGRRRVYLLNWVINLAMHWISGILLGMLRLVRVVVFWLFVPNTSLVKLRTNHHPRTLSLVLQAWKPKKFRKKNLSIMITSMEELISWLTRSMIKRWIFWMSRMRYLRWSIEILSPPKTLFEINDRIK